MKGAQLLMKSNSLNKSRVNVPYMYKISYLSVSTMELHAHLLIVYLSSHFLTISADGL